MGRKRSADDRTQNTRRVDVEDGDSRQPKRRRLRSNEHAIAQPAVESRPRRRNVAIMYRRRGRSRDFESNGSDGDCERVESSASDDEDGESESDEMDSSDDNEAENEADSSETEDQSLSEENEGSGNGALLAHNLASDLSCSSSNSSDDGEHTPEESPMNQLHQRRVQQRAPTHRPRTMTRFRGLNQSTTRNHLSAQCENVNRNVNRTVARPKVRSREQSQLDSRPNRMNTLSANSLADGLPSHTPTDQTDASERLGRLRRIRADEESVGSVGSCIIEESPVASNDHTRPRIPQPFGTRDRRGAQRTNVSTLAPKRPASDQIPGQRTTDQRINSQVRCLFTPTASAPAVAPASNQRTAESTTPFQPRRVSLSLRLSGVGSRAGSGQPGTQVTTQENTNRNGGSVRRDRAVMEALREKLNKRHSELLAGLESDSERAQEDLEECPVCTESFDENAHARAQPNACRHWFCITCLERWSHQSDLCPLCKTQYTAIKKYEKGVECVEIPTSLLKESDPEDSDDYDEELETSEVSEDESQVDELYNFVVRGGSQRQIINGRCLACNDRLFTFHCRGCGIDVPTGCSCSKTSYVHCASSLILLYASSSVDIPFLNYPRSCVSIAHAVY
eukprot:Blabericola_migrator_1__2799@NODE_17_length_22983_cov_74_609923_g14_i0_p5_GENE_NODE_17_length_22983_cov_74_609923_g14_i0NODE_17_length_22983_cov_74_609923_g14_i0_p5_ORF_typecomplete_len622_score90_99zfRING_2/PF13639_6/9_6e09zfC3HC4_3/PF13920_6/4_5e07zfC3HC4_2/PF13923_6/2_4e06ProkRING_4/PF14447_6/25ProkRING_4/PF14447_6/0_00012zfRING_5/PF14634_6/5_6e05zfC3HC4/PF00097_25/0_00039FdhE/PF04216_12/8_4e03FdhE/PF04216_12/0_00046zfRING_4/PF14570_6/0_00082zfRING_4/PF14570_6/2_6e03zfrbx1/PF12678_7/0_0013FYV